MLGGNNHIAEKWKDLSDTNSLQLTKYQEMLAWSHHAENENVQVMVQDNNHTLQPNKHPDMLSSSWCYMYIYLAWKFG